MAMARRLVEVGLLKGKTVAIDATTLEANAAMRSIVWTPLNSSRTLRAVRRRETVRGRDDNSPRKVPNVRKDRTVVGDVERLRAQSRQRRAGV
jgi:hypothetical protein